MCFKTVWLFWRLAIKISCQILSSDSIVTTTSAASLPPVNIRRRHSSQDRVGRFSVKTSSSQSSIKSPGTTYPSVPIALPPRPKVQKSKSNNDQAKPKQKYVRSTSGPIISISGVSSANVVVLEEVDLAKNARSRSSLSSRRTRETRLFKILFDMLECSM